MKDRRLSRFLTVALTALLTAPALAAPTARYSLLEGCDLDKDFLIDDAELLRCIVRQEKIEFQQFPLAAEIPKLIGESCLEVQRTVETIGTPEDLLAKIKFLLAHTMDERCRDAKDFLQAEPPYSFAQLAHFWKLPPDHPAPPFLVRRNVQDGSLLTDARALTAPPGALLGYSRNFLDDAEVLHLEGAFIVYRPLAPAGRWLRAAAPSLSFRLLKIERDGRPAGGEIDELIARQTFHFLRRAKNPDREWDHELRLGAAFVTDFDFDRQIAAFEADWQPFRLGTCFGNYRPFHGLQYRCGFGLRAEAGEVLDGGDFRIPEETFARIGPTLSFQLMRAPWTLSFRYHYRLELEGDADDTDLFRASLDVALDPAGHWTFNAAYERGELPISLRSVRSLVVGVGVRY